jgi:hypothetical protein
VLGEVASPAVLPPSLVGESHRGGFVCAEWELRVTERCLRDDLGAPGAAFENITSREIVKAFVKDRFDQPEGTREVAPLTQGDQIWVVAYGHDHRGGTWFDEVNRVVWLVAYGLHRSGQADDFFPYCKALDEADELLPRKEDYKALIEDRDWRFSAALRIEAPLILKEARELQAELRRLLGGTHGACIAVEVSEDLEQTTIAFKTPTVVWDYVPVILAAFHPDGEWDGAASMPSRPLDDDEVAFVHLHESA